MAPTTGTDASVQLDGDGHELIGTTIDGRYLIEGTIGRGGMGLVYRASQVNLRRHVALKILHPSLAASSDVRNRFAREALAVGKIVHPNCVAVYDSGHLPDGSLFLAMELLEGRSLADVLEQERFLAPGRALHILAHILRGLEHIHQAELIHRDIKPENIYLVRHREDEDFAKILDFGIAKPMKGEIDDGVKLTQAGMAFGTPIYMAPEQALGNPLDGRADLYATAIIAYEMLTGVPPFYSDDKLEVMSMHTARPVPPMRQKLVRGAKPIPTSIERLVARGLTKKPADRWKDAAQFLEAVMNALETTDGGATDVEFERPETTGSQSLVTDEGKVNITGGSEVAAIGDAIDEVLAVPAPRAMTPARPLGLATAKPMGGVGIGLPYTGPGGVPLFGLTPEQRLPKPRPKSRRMIYAGIAAAAVVVGIIIAIATLPGGPSSSAPLAAATEALERGDPKGALKLLGANLDAIATDGKGQLLLGRAHSALNDRMSSLQAFAKALTYAPELEADHELRASLRAMAADKDAQIVAAAFDLWAGHTKDPEARQAIAKAAITDDLARRHAVRPVIDKYELGGGIDWLEAYGFDLEQESTCELRKAAIAKLRALGDARAVAPLERAIVRKAKNGRPLNGCLVDDANAAIGFLKGLGPKGT